MPEEYTVDFNTAYIMTLRYFGITAKELDDLVFVEEFALVDF